MKIFLCYLSSRKQLVVKEEKYKKAINSRKRKVIYNGKMVMAIRRFKKTIMFITEVEETEKIREDPSKNNF